MKTRHLIDATARGPSIDLGAPPPATPPHTPDPRLDNIADGVT
jgi:hypothetical protein